MVFADQGRMRNGKTFQLSRHDQEVDSEDVDYGMADEGSVDEGTDVGPLAGYETEEAYEQDEPKNASQHPACLILSRLTGAIQKLDGQRGDYVGSSIRIS